MQIREHQDHFWVEFDNGVAVEIRMDGRRYRGIGRVKCGRRDMRSPELPIIPLIVTPDGYEVSRLELDDLRHGDDDLVMSFRPYVRLTGHTQQRGLDGNPCWNVGPWGQEPVRDRGGRLWLRLREVNRLIGELEYVGFSYGYKFRSRKHRPHCIHDRATWELGGRATGNGLIMRGAGGGARRRIRSKGDEFTTARVFPDRPPLQLRPLFTDLQGFTFQFDRQGVLVTAFERPFECHSLIQKAAGDNRVVHWHQLQGAGSSGGGCLDFPSLEVLWAASPSAGDETRINQYEALREHLYERYHAALDLQRDGSTCVGEIAPPATAQAAELAQAVDELAAAGCVEVLVRGLVAEPDLGKAARRLKRIVDLAHRRGLEAGVSLDPAVLGCAADPEGAPASRSGRAGRSLSDLLKRLKKESGLDVVHLQDESPLSGPAPGARAGSLQAQVALQRAIQEQGCRCRVERSGIFGVPIGPVPYRLLRNDELLYRDSIVPFPYEEVLAGGDSPREAYFRGYASRVCYRVRFNGWQEEGAGLEQWWDPDFAAINKAFCAVEDHMDYPRVLRGGRGVLWDASAGDVRVLWAFRDFDWRVGGKARVFDVMVGKAAGIQTGVFNAKANCVYLVQHALDL